MVFCFLVPAPFASSPDLMLDEVRKSIKAAISANVHIINELELRLGKLQAQLDLVVARDAAAEPCKRFQPALADAMRQVRATLVTLSRLELVVAEVRFEHFSS